MRTPGARSEKLSAFRAFQVLTVYTLVLFWRDAGATVRAFRSEGCADCDRIKFLASGHLRLKCSADASKTKTL
jgi:hypothetical protein